MYCKYCGKQVVDNASFCGGCGQPINDNGQIFSNNYDARPYQNNNNFSNHNDSVQDSGSAGWGVLGFFIPIVGLILFIVWNSSKPKSAKSAGIGALIGVILEVFLVIFLSILVPILMVPGIVHVYY